MTFDLNTHDNEVTLEHIAVLQERMADLLADAYDESDAADVVRNHFDPLQVKEEMLALFTREAFLKMFQTEMGKGVLMGAFIQKFIFGDEEDEA